MTQHVSYKSVDEEGGIPAPEDNDPPEDNPPVPENEGKQSAGDDGQDLRMMTMMTRMGMAAVRMEEEVVAEGMEKETRQFSLGVVRGIAGKLYVWLASDTSQRII